MISVIVPVYNMEAYLCQCLDSLAAQTYRDVEFILVDDGSKDGSGAICESYAEKDARFRVFHTANHGLSAARNYGIEHSGGNWLMFVDSDDWVSPQFCEIPMETAETHEADLVIFQFSNNYPNGKTKKEPKGKKEKPWGVVTHEQAQDYGGVAVWNKLYRKDLFSGIRYPEGHTAEDVATTHKLVYRAGRIVLLQDTLIYHRIIRQSLSHNRGVPKAERDLFSFRIQRYHDLTELGYNEAKAKSKLQRGAMAYCVYMPEAEDELYRQAEQLLKETDGIPADWPRRDKLALTLWKKNRKLFRFFCRFLRKPS